MEISEYRLKRASDLKEFLTEKGLGKYQEDIVYSLTKIRHHIENFDMFFKRDIEQLKKEIFDLYIKEIEHLEFSEDSTITYTLKSEYLKLTLIKVSFIYEWDCIVQEIKRCMDITIKLLCKIIDNPNREIDKTQNFFKSLKGELDTPGKCCIIIANEHQKLKEYLIKQWDLWLKEVNNLRTNTVHKSIINKIESKSFTVEWKVSSKKHIPSKITLDPLMVEGKPLEQYLKELQNKITEFVSFIMDFIYLNYVDTELAKD